MFIGRVTEHRGGERRCDCDVKLISEESKQDVQANRLIRTGLALLPGLSPVHFGHSANSLDFPVSLDITLHYLTNS